MKKTLRVTKSFLNVNESSRVDLIKFYMKHLYFDTFKNNFCDLLFKTNKNKKTLELKKTQKQKRIEGNISLYNKAHILQIDRNIITEILFTILRTDSIAYIFYYADKDYKLFGTEHYLTLIALQDKSKVSRQVNKAYKKLAHFLCELTKDQD